MTRRRTVGSVGRTVALLLLVAYAVPTHVLAQLSPDALFSSASPAVVKLTVKDERNLEIGTGSGYVVAFEEKITGDARHFESTIITNYHVVYPAVEIDVLFQGKGTGQAQQVLVEDPFSDIAILTVWSSGKPDKTLKFCDGEAPAIGSKVYTIGSPLGFTNTLSEGLVSGYRERDAGAGWMQISAPISPGSSGGAVLSVDGCVLGMTTASVVDGQNLNFAIPTKEISRVLKGPKKPREVREHELDPRVMCRKLVSEQKDRLHRWADRTLQSGALLDSGNDPQAGEIITPDDRKRCVVACESAVALEPRNTELLLNLDTSYHSVAIEGDLQILRKAVQVLERVVELDPRSVDAFSRLCSEYGMLGEHDSAILNCRKAMSVEPLSVNISYLREKLIEATKRKMTDLRFRVPPEWIPTKGYALAHYKLPSAKDGEKEVELRFRLPHLPETEGTFPKFLAKWAHAFDIDPKKVNV